MRVLVVEDDPLVGDAVRRSLSTAGFAADLVGDAESARSAVLSENFDLLVLDLGLPQESGLQLLRNLRTRGKLVPVLILTARDGVDDRVAALDLGADDYLAKPFHVPELIARCRALIRRANAISSAHLVIGRLTLDLAHKAVALDGEKLDLTHREWSILECLALNSGHIVSKDKLMSAIANFTEDLTLNAIEVYVSRLRAKLAGAARIRAVRGMGYCIDDKI
jgi:two-component system, OmpR family, response regulator